MWLDNTKGEGARRRKLTADEVREMRRLYQEGTTAKTLADKYGVTRHHVMAIIRYKQWASVE